MKRFYHKAKKQTKHLTNEQIQNLITKKGQERAKTIEEVSRQNLNEDTNFNNLTFSICALESHNIRRKNPSTHIVSPSFVRMLPVSGIESIGVEYDIVRLVPVRPEKVNKALRHKGMLGI